MKRSKVRNIDYWTYIFTVSVLLVFLIFKSMGIIVELSQTVELELSRYIRGFSVLIVPVYGMFFCAVTFTVCSALFLRKTFPADGIIPSVLVGLTFVIVGVLNQSVWPYLIGAVVGLYLWYNVVKYLGLFMVGIPIIVDSQKWSESSLDYEHRAPEYWVYVINVLYLLSVLSFPVFFIYSLSLHDASWAAALIASSVATSLGLFYLKREKSIGYLFYILPIACLVLFFLPSQGGVSNALSLESNTLIKLIFSFVPVLMIGLSCFACWGRMIGKVFEE
ncbi:hypothetical protein TDB9533_00454 [Thalassocella blandensis]|nr:hypothetical protein TDB9533_00454 [Thalassocella blandensis]